MADAPSERTADTDTRTRYILNTALDAVITINEHGAITEWNAQAESTFGWRYDEVVGRLLTELVIPPRYQTAHANGLRNFLSTGVGPILNRRVEITAVRRDGSEFPVELSVAPYQVGAAWLFSGFVRDITERKRAENALRQSEERFRAIIDNSPNLIFLKDTGDRYVLTNKRFELFFRMERQNIIGKRDHEIFSPAQVPAFHVNDEAVLQADGHVMSEELIVQPDGPRWVIIDKFPLRDPDGVTYAIAGIATDITERKRAEEALRASEVRWRTMFEKSPVGIVLRDADERYMAANPAFQAMVGYSESELTTLGPLDFTHEDDLAASERMLGEFEVGVRQSAEIEKRFRRKDGTVVWAMISTFSVPEAGATPAYYPAIVVDITKRKKAEEALRESELELARVSRVTTIGELTASIAHELRQPLSAAVTNATTCQHWLSADNLDLARARRAAQRMMEAANRASDVMDRIRKLLNRAPPQRVSVAINDLLCETLAVIETDLRARQIVVATHLAEPPPFVVGDRVQLQQVILNLIMNSVEAMSSVVHRPRLLRISSRREADSILVAVEDSGTGLDPTAAKRMFDPFFTTKAGGMGMGLSICRTIIDGHGGRLWASPAQSHGALVQFTLPMGDSLS